jgi:N6-L-threonylcarbamoyladenine synthase
MSFSGLKTAVLRARDTLVTVQTGLTGQDQADLAASFQAAVADVLAQKARKALSLYLAETTVKGTLAVAGGVAANQTIRAALETVCRETEATFLAPPLALCTDNAAMIAYAGMERFAHGQTDNMGLAARPRWPLDQTSAALIGSGKKGAKA